MLRLVLVVMILLSICSCATSRQYSFMGEDATTTIKEGHIYIKPHSYLGRFSKREVFGFAAMALRDHCANGKFSHDKTYDWHPTGSRGGFYKFGIQCPDGERKK